MQKNGTDEIYLEAVNRNPDVENGHVDTRDGGGGGEELGD